MKHVWILNHYAEEPGSPGGTRHHALARHLPASGWKATIIAASTGHASGCQRLDRGETRRLQIIDGVPFLWLRTRAYEGNGRDRILNMLDYTRAVLKRNALRDLDPPDAIVGSSVHPLAAWAARKLARRHRVPFLFEVRDLWPQTLIDMGRISRRHPAAVALRGLERSLYRSAARIIVLLPNAGDYIVPFGIPEDRIVWIPNGVDLERFPGGLGAGVPNADPADPFTLMYFGAHGVANGLDQILAAMKIVESEATEKKVVLRLVGHGPEKSALIALAERSGLANVRFEPPVAKGEIPKLAAQADAFVLSTRDLPGLYRFGVSMNKIFDYMAAERPTIIALNAANNPIAEAGAGFTVPPERPAELAEAILRMASLPREERLRMGRAGRQHAESHYNTELLSARLAATLDACLEAR